MSARREARARLPLSQRHSGPDEMPRALLVGCLVDVWGDPSEETMHYSARRRFAAARRHWGERAGATTEDLQQLIPHRHPWTLEYLNYKGQAERVGRPLHVLVEEWMAVAGCTLADIPALIEEADELFAQALGDGALTRSYRRRRPT